MDRFDLTGKTAVVIGGSSVLGGSMAEALAAHGADVALVGRDAKRLEAVAGRGAQSGDDRGGARSFPADATSRANLLRVRDEVLSWTGRVDILLNSVGVNSTTPFFSLTDEEWDAIMRVNARSVMQACQIFGEQMVKAGRGGSIVNISSVSSGPPLSKVFTYSASKASVNSMTQFLARELAPHRIRVNAIIPGFFPAVQNRAILTPERTAAILQHTPLGRFGEPEELQGTVVWLASERASGFVTGALIRVDGGFGAMSI